MTRETAVKLKNLLYGIASKIQGGRKRTVTGLNGEEKIVYEIKLNFHLSSKEDLERIANEIEKEFL